MRPYTSNASQADKPEKSGGHDQGREDRPWGRAVLVYTQTSKGQQEEEHLKHDPGTSPQDSRKQKDGLIDPHRGDTLGFVADMSMAGTKTEIKHEEL